MRPEGRYLVNISVLGIVYSLSAALVWGTVPVVYRFCMVRGSPFKLQAFRGVGFLVFAVVIALVLPEIVPAPVVTIVVASLGGLSANLVGDTLFMYGIRHIGASASAAVAGTSPLFASLLSVVLLREPLTVGIMAGIGCVLGGLFLFQSRERGTFAEIRPGDVRIGLLLSLLTALFWGMSFVASRWAITRGNITAPGIVFWQAISFFAASWLSWGVLWERSERREPFVRWPLRETIAMLSVGALSLGLAGGLSSAALKHAPASVVTPISATGPIITAFWGRLLLGERLGARQWVGIGLILVGGALLTLG